MGTQLEIVNLKYPHLPEEHHDGTILYGDVHKIPAIAQQ